MPKQWPTTRRELPKTRLYWWQGLIVHQQIKDMVEALWPDTPGDFVPLEDPPVTTSEPEQPKPNRAQRRAKR